MADPIFSPDGKWMWTGSEWIPAPPTAPQVPGSTINLHDSMMSGNMNVEENSNDASSAINLKDSSMSGDINITQNDPKAFAAAMVEALERLGFSKNSTPANLSAEEEMEVEQILQLSEEYSSPEYENSADTELSIGRAALWAGKLEKAEKNLIQALTISSRDGDTNVQAHSLNLLAKIAGLRFEHEEVERLASQCLKLSILVEDRELQIECLQHLAIVKKAKNALDEAELHLQEALSITKEISNKSREADIYRDLGNFYANSQDRLDDAEAMARKSVQIHGDLGNLQGEAKGSAFLASILSEKTHSLEIEQLFRSSIKTLSQIGDRTGELAASMQFASYLHKRSMLQEAEKLYHGALEYFENVGNLDIAAMLLMEIGEISKDKGDLEGAKENLLKALEIRKAIGDRYGQLVLFANLGYINWEQGDMIKSKRYHQKRLKVAQELSNYEEEANALIDLAIIAQGNNNEIEQRRLNVEAVRIWREIGTPVPQWYLDNGY